MVLSTMPLARGLVSLVRVPRRVERGVSWGFVRHLERPQAQTEKAACFFQKPLSPLARALRPPLEPLARSPFLRSAKKGGKEKEGGRAEGGKGAKERCEKKRNGACSLSCVCVRLRNTRPQSWARYARRSGSGGRRRKKGRGEPRPCLPGLFSAVPERLFPRVRRGGCSPRHQD